MQRMRSMEKGLGGGSWSFDHAIPIAWRASGQAQRDLARVFDRNVAAKFGGAVVWRTSNSGGKIRTSVRLVFGLPIAARRTCAAALPNSCRGQSMVVSTGLG